MRHKIRHPPPGTMPADRRPALLWAGLVALFLLLGGGVALAQLPASPPAASAPEVPPPSVDEAVDQLLRALDDPAVRAELAKRLRASAPGPPQPPPEGDFVSESLDVVGSSAARVSEVLLESAQAVGRLPELLAWLAQQTRNPHSQRVFVEVVGDLAFAVGAALLPALLIHVGLHRLRRRLLPDPNRTWAARGAVVLGRVLAELAPVVMFVGLLITLIKTLDLTPLAQLIARQLVLAVLLGRTVAAVRRALLYPLSGPGRLLPVSDEQALVLNRNLMLLAALSIYGYFALQIALLFQLSWDLHQVLQHLLFLTVAVLAVMMVLRSRQGVHDWLLAFETATGEEHRPRLLPWRGIARYWHIVAIAWIAVHFLAWALDLPGGMRWVIINNIATLGLLVAARLAALALRDPPEPASETGGAEAQPVAGRADPGAVRREAGAAMRGTVRAAVDVLTYAALVILWTPGLSEWLSDDAGTAFITKLLQIVIVAGVAFLLWLAVNNRVQTYLAAVDPSGLPKHGSRARTLAVMARNGVLVVLFTFTVIFALATLGVNTGPLLAGAGVIGIAVGFGSQRLVQDIINGLFILLSDAVRVGDVVDLGGRSGVVEAISMRTVTLRSYSGDVHTIPYSTIDVVTNMTKDFSFAVLDVAVSYREDVDRVMELLRDIDRQLRREWPFRRLMLDPIEIAGLDRFGEIAVVIRGRIKVLAGEQWRVGREFNRRIKQRFDQLGIEIPVAYRSLVVRADEAPVHGAAPPVAKAG
jgi:small conductance mechanosensitive channel